MTLEKKEELLIVSSGSLAGLMPKRHAAIPEEKIRELLYIVEVIRLSEWSDRRVARKLGCSPPAVRKWVARAHGDEGGSYPAPGYFVPLQKLAKELEKELPKDVLAQLAQDVAASPTKSAVQSNQPLRSRHGGVTSRHSPGDVPSWLSKGGAAMGELVQMRVPAEEATRYPELEVCVWYHRKDMDRRVVGWDVVDGARAGRYEGQGCDKWDGSEWWAKLLEMEGTVRKTSSGTHRTVKGKSLPLKDKE